MTTNKLNDLPNTNSPIELEKHYTVAQVAEAWALSCATIRHYFEKLPGVIRIGRQATRTKRKYVTLRIPASILHAEHSRMTGSAACH